MQIRRLAVQNFRGIRSAVVLLPKHGVLIGDNNTGKTTLLEAIDLALGPDRLGRMPPVDEHDFFQGEYGSERAILESKERDQAEGVVPEEGVTGENLEAEAAAAEEKTETYQRIEVEVAVVDLSDEQKARFGAHIEFWDKATDSFYDQPDPTGVDAASITEALRVTFRGWYDPEEDDFEGKTYFTSSLDEDSPATFSKKDKLACGFLYLRSLRTGSRALSLERGSLLDVILRLKEVRPHMWENIIKRLTELPVAADPQLGLTGVLESINAALKRYVPKEWGVEPHLRVSNLTREHLRKVITAFIATGEGSHAAPFFRQGTGTINMLVLAMLSQLAEDKQNVIFAMEEPETAIPPYAQKRIVHEVRQLASQALFTSHSPYVLEEFALDETVVLRRDAEGVLTRCAVALPDSVKPKRYRREFRTRFCEGLLARRILVAEGATEAAAFPVVCRRLEELRPDRYSSLEALGICTVDAGGEGNVSDMARFYRELGKRVFALTDNQSADDKVRIEAEVDMLLMHGEDGLEDLVLRTTTEEALRRFARTVDWPGHLRVRYPDPEAQPQAALKEYFGWAKANWGIADFLAQCMEAEIPEWLRESCLSIGSACAPAASTATGRGLGSEEMAEPDSTPSANGAN